LRIVQERLDDAEAELAGMRDIAPESAPAAGLAAVIAMVRGDARTAMAHYQHACELAPDYPNCYASLAAAQGMAGRVPDADATIVAAAARPCRRSAATRWRGARGTASTSTSGARTTAGRSDPRAQADAERRAAGDPSRRDLPRRGGRCRRLTRPVRAADARLV